MKETPKSKKIYGVSDPNAINQEWHPETVNVSGASLKMLGKLPIEQREKKPPVKRENPKQEGEFTFYLDPTGKLIARRFDGKIGIIDRHYTGVIPSEGETWVCQIIHDDVKKVIISPAVIKTTAKENQELLTNKIDKFKTLGFKTKTLNYKRR